jgi:2-oxo-4-hydroxy-4-carboxy-5-ureidoimidazoline decarboxylase
MMESYEISDTRRTIERVNALDREEFVRLVGPVFERSPWIVEAVWPARPFASVEQLHQRLCDVVRAAGEARQLRLIRAHPDLVGRAAESGTHTAESKREQASAGLDRLSAEEAALFRKYNERYRDRFGFPFIICARLNKKDAILAAFPRRLQNSREQELQTALAEVFQIARLRLADIIKRCLTC